MPFFQSCGDAAGAAAPRKRQRVRRIRDESAPRLPKTGYVLFIGERRKEIFREMPKLRLADQNRLLAREWTTMPPDTKQVVALDCLPKQSPPSNSAYNSAPSRHGWMRKFGGAYYFRSMLSWNMLILGKNLHISYGKDVICGAISSSIYRLHPGERWDQPSGWLFWEPNFCGTYPVYNGTCELISWNLMWTIWTWITHFLVHLKWAFVRFFARRSVPLRLNIANRFQWIKWSKSKKCILWSGL